MKSQKTLLIFVLFLLLQNLCLAQNTVVMDPHVSSRQVEGAFNQIKISDGIIVFLSQSNENGLAVSADREDDKKDILTTVEDGLLKISFRQQNGWRNNRRKLRVYVGFSDISTIVASGGSDIYIIDSLQAKSLQINLSGASRFSGLVHLEDLKIDLSGASQMTITGSSAAANLTASGASDLSASKMIVQDCIARISGTSDVKISVSRSLNANASGSSNFYYTGKPNTTISATGGSKISESSPGKKRGIHIKIY